MAKIIGTGFYVPSYVVSNDDITKSGKWVEDNLGIKERRKSLPWQGSQYLGENAGMYAIQRSGLQSEEIDMIIVATSTPEKIAPSTACLIKHSLGLENAIAFDINAVCSGFLYALSIAEQFLSKYDNILIICVDVFSRITDYENRDCVFFGDGAGAVVVTRGDNLKQITIGSDAESNGFICDHGGTFEMNKHLVYDTALRILPKVIRRALSGVSIKEIDWMLPHQPSKRILLDIADKIGLLRGKVLMNMDRYANTSAATIPILLAEKWDMFKEGEKLLFASIGSGWTFGAAIYEV